MTHFRHLAVVALLGLSVAACSSPPPEPRFSPASFANEPVFAFNVARIEVVSEFKSNGIRPHIEYEMPVSPEAGLRRWAQDRLKAVGHEGTLKVVIRDATATENPLPTDTGFSSNFKKQEVARVDMSITVALQVLDDRQFVKAEVTQTNNISQTELEGLKLNEREELLYKTVTEMTKTFDKAIDPTIRDTLGTYLGTP